MIRSLTLSHLKSGQTIKLLDLKKKNKDEPRSASKRELFQWIAWHERTFYDNKALYLRNAFKEKKISEGASERAIRHMLGYGIENKDMPGETSIDLAGEMGEIKELISNTGSILEIRLGQVALDNWGICRGAIERLVGYQFLSEEQKSSVNCGSLSRCKLQSFPNDVRQVVLEHLKPSNVMSKYRNIYAGGLECYLKVPYEDFDKAWKFSCITQGGRIKYGIRRHYLVRRVINIYRREGFKEERFTASSFASFFGEPEVLLRLTPEIESKFPLRDVSMDLGDGLRISVSHLHQGMTSFLSRLRQQFPIVEQVLKRHDR